MREKGFKVSISGTGADELFTRLLIIKIYILQEIYKNKKIFFNSLKLWKKYQKFDRISILKTQIIH